MYRAGGGSKKEFNQCHRTPWVSSSLGTQCPQGPFLGADIISHGDLLEASKAALNQQRSLGDYKVAAALLPPGPQEAGVHEPYSLLAPPFLGKAASMVRGPFLQGAVNGYCS